MLPVRAFTTIAKQRVSVLTNDVRVAKAFDPSLPASEHPPYKMFKAIWDTGASASVINETIVAELGLLPTGMTKVHHAQGTTTAETYLVNIALPNKVAFQGLRVTKGILTNGDLLVGMDIIGQGDFAVSNHNGQTVFSYRIPSVEHIDFTGKMVNPAQSIRSVPKVGRNDPCPCGSGKKYKKCHGASRKS